MSDVIKLLNEFFTKPSSGIKWLTAASAHEHNRPRRNGLCLHTTWKGGGWIGDLTSLHSSN